MSDNVLETASKRPSHSKSPLVRNPLLWLAGVFVALGLIAVVALRHQAPPPPPVLASLPNFEFRNQDNQTVGLDHFKGSVSVFDFIFTSCPDVCPLLTQQMVKMQERAAGLKLPIQFASISVDPNTDTPAVLKAYAQKHQANLNNWVFLTGPLAAVEKVVLEGFKVGLDRGPSQPDIFDITHTEHFVLVDQLGRIRAYVRAANSDEIDKLLAQVAALIKNPAS